MMRVENIAMRLGLRGIDVRHEQAAAMAAHAYARLLNRPGVCMAASGPGVTNLVTGIAHSMADCTPVVALGGASPAKLSGTGAFQEMDQLALMKPITKWAERVHHVHRIPELIDRAFRNAVTGKPGPVYLDLPGDILFEEIEESKIEWPEPYDPARRVRPAANPEEIVRAIELLETAERPAVIAGSGVLWSDAGAELKQWVEMTGVPFYTTPQSRGIIPEDHPNCYLKARGTAFHEADLIVVVGTRLNYIVGHLAPPRFHPDAKIIRVDIDPDEIGSTGRVQLGIVGDAKVVLQQLIDASLGRLSADAWQSWRDRLRGRNASSSQAGVNESSETVPMHPLRLCAEIRDFMPRDGILCVDGQEILNFGRQAIPTYVAGHRINSGTFGTMGVGLPFGVGAKIAAPEKFVTVLHGDGSFGFNAMEFDTAVRHRLGILVVISLNGGWTADPKREKPGRDLGFTRYDRMAEALGGVGIYVEDPLELKPALERAREITAGGVPVLVNVKTDPDARASTASFTQYST